MKGGDGRIDVGYNCQAVVTDNHLIVSSEVIQDPNDRNALELMIETTEENIEEEVKELAADTGYSSYENYEYLSKKNKIGYIPDQEINNIEKQESSRCHRIILYMIKSEMNTYVLRGID